MRCLGVLNDETSAALANLVLSAENRSVGHRFGTLPAQIEHPEKATRWLPPLIEPDYLGTGFAYGRLVSVLVGLQSPQPDDI